MTGQLSAALGWSGLGSFLPSRGHLERPAWASGHSAPRERAREPAAAEEALDGELLPGRGPDLHAFAREARVFAEDRSSPLALYLANDGRSGPGLLGRVIDLMA